MKIDYLLFIQLQNKVKEINKYVPFQIEEFNTFTPTINRLQEDSCDYFDSLCETIFNENITKSKKKNVVPGNLPLKNHLDFINEEFKVDNISVNLNLYEDYYFRTYLTHDHKRPQERYFPKKSNVFKISPINNWTQNNFLSWHTGFKGNLKKMNASLIDIFNALAAVYIMLSIKNEKDFKKGLVPKEMNELFSISENTPEITETNKKQRGWGEKLGS